jgi:hypothetical protein
MPKGAPLPPKRDVVHALLAQGAAFLHLDPRGDDVFVPEWLKRQPQLVLQIGLSMPVPIRDLRIDDVGVFGTLSFSRAPFTCMVPWEAVFALVGEDGRGMVWPESMPEEIAQEIQREAQRAGLTAIAEVDAAGTTSPAPRRARKSSALKELVASAEPGKPGHEPDEDRVSEPKGLRLIEGEGIAKPQASSPKRRARPAPHLRLVKR